MGCVKVNRKEAYRSQYAFNVNIITFERTQLAYLGCFDYSHATQHAASPTHGQC